MYDAIIALVIPAVMIAIIFAWVPLLNFVFPPRARFSKHPHPQNFAPEADCSLLFASRIKPSSLAPHHELVYERTKSTRSLTQAAGEA